MQARKIELTAAQCQELEGLRDHAGMAIPARESSRHLESGPRPIHSLGGSARLTEANAPGPVARVDQPLPGRRSRRLTSASRTRAQAHFFPLSMRASRPLPPTCKPFSIARHASTA